MAKKLYYNSKEMLNGIPSQVDSLFGFIGSILSKCADDGSETTTTTEAYPSTSYPSGTYDLDTLQAAKGLEYGKYEPIKWSEGQNLFYKGCKGILIDWQTGAKIAIQRGGTKGGSGGGANHADIEVQPGPASNPHAHAKTFATLTPAGSFTPRPGVLIIDGLDNRPIACSFHTAIHAGRDDKPGGVSCSGRSRNYGTGTNWDWVKGNGWDGHVCLYMLGSVGHSQPDPNQGHNLAHKKNILLVSKKYYDNTGR